MYSKDAVQLMFDFSDCYKANFPPLDLKKYENDRNYKFYVAQEEYIETRSKASWETMYDFIFKVCLSTVRKMTARTNCPDREGKAIDAALLVLNNYKKDDYYRIEKLETVSYWKVKEIIYNKNLQICEKSASLDCMLEVAGDKAEIPSSYSNFENDLIEAMDKERENEK